MQKTILRQYLLVVMSLFLLASCSKFSKLQKTGTQQEKYAAALDYYKKGEYYKAGLLFEELIPLLKGGTEAELAEFYNAYSQFHQGMYSTSQFQFKKFYETYARSQYAQEAFYMHAFSLYKDSPPASLDQSNTMTAISALQDFINRYPDSPFQDECTKYILELREKLEFKAYEKAKLYYKISDFQFYSLKSSVIAISNFQKDFPDSKYNEELAYLKVDAQYNLAKNSLPNKQKERYLDVLSHYRAFVDKYPKSGYGRDAEKLYSESQKEVEKIIKIEEEIQKYREKLENAPDAPARISTSGAQPKK
jgi:outer membrane protein assembly factor BamD